MRSGNLAPYVESTRDGAGVLGAFDAFQPEIEARCGRGSSSLFARPYLTKAHDGGVSSISWYTDIDGTAVRWIDLDPQSREQIAADVRAAVERLERVLRDPSIGPSVQRALNVADFQHDLLIVGGKPVLTNWGLLPTEILNDPEARRAHWEQGLGAILQHRDLPPFLDTDPEMRPTGHSSAGAGVDNALPHTLGITPPAAILPPASTMAASQQTAKAIPSWVWPAAASGLVFVAILLLLLMPRFGLLPTAHGIADREAQDEIAVLRQRAVALRGILSNPCAEPIAQ